MDVSVSVIIPAFNSACTVEETLESVRAQTCSVTEVIVVDDASTDNTVAVVDRWFDRTGVCGRVLRSEENAGPAAARNRGVRDAKGDWIAFLDADDAWLPHRLSLQLALVAKVPDMAMWCGETITLGSLSQEISPASQVQAYSVLSLDAFVEGCPVSTSTVLVRREALLSVGGFDEQFRGPEDYDLWMRLAVRHSMAKIKAVLSAYRYVPYSLSMDDRCFLPQVLRVLEKAFAPGGVYAERPELHDVMVDAQYWHAAWMAFSRGSRVRALRLWLRALRFNQKARHAVKRPRWRLLARYLLGRPPASG